MVTPSHKGLGKGLSALISEDYSRSAALGPETITTTDEKSSSTLSVHVIVSGKFQPRSRFTEEYLKELAESIRRNGIMQPIVVRPAPEQIDKYEIIAGERRWRAAQLAGLTDVPVIIRDIDDQQALELALIENIQRQDLTPLEEAAGYQRLIDEFSHTQEELSKTVGKSRSHVANLLRLLTLPESIKQLLDEDKITMGHARALLNVANPEELANEVVKRGLNVRQTENIARTGIIGTEQSTQHKSLKSFTPKEKDPDILALESTLSESLGLNVSIEDNGQSGKIIISYDSLSQLDNILKRLGGTF
jgi:ParB family transcriptional regulator, chromosome partitioning protein